jgi:hypothetical protein
LFFHHGELIISTDSQVRSSQTNNGIISDVSVLFDDDTHTGELLGPNINGSIAPESFIIIVSDL